MVKRETIGKVQLTIGIIVLITSIIGFYVAYNINSNLYDSPYKPDFKSLEETNISNETKAILFLENVQIYKQELFFQGEIIINLSLFYALTILLYLLFITQGLVNI